MADPITFGQCWMGVEDTGRMIGYCATVNGRPAQEYSNTDAMRNLPVVAVKVTAQGVAIQSARYAQNGVDHYYQTPGAHVTTRTCDTYSDTTHTTCAQWSAPQEIPVHDMRFAQNAIAPLLAHPHERLQHVQAKLAAVLQSPGNYLCRSYAVRAADASGTTTPVEWSFDFWALRAVGANRRIDPRENVGAPNFTIFIDVDANIVAQGFDDDPLAPQALFLTSASQLLIPQLAQIKSFMATRKLESPTPAHSQGANE